MATIASTGKERAWVAAVKRVTDTCWQGTTNNAEQAPLALNNESVLAVNAAGTGTVALIKADTGDDIRIGPGVDTIVKVFNRPTTDAIALQVKSEYTGTTSGHNCVEVTADCKSALATGGGNTAVQGVSRLAATYTATGGTIIGTYGQACNLGTLNGSGILVAGTYSLIEDGGTWTAVDHVAASWLDSHLTKTVSAGKKDMQYITNNGTTVFDDVFYVYGGNKINALLSLDTCGTMVVKTPGTYSTADGYICINVDGVAMRIPYFAAVD